MTQLDLAIRGELSTWTAAVAKSVEAGARRALRRATFGLRTNLRGRIRRAGFRSPGLAAALAAKVDAQQLEGRVYSVARYRAGGQRTQPLDLIQLYSEGATIQAASGSFLAIPTGLGPQRQAGRGRMRRATPQEIGEMGWKIAILPARGGKMVVLATLPSGAKVVTHVLVRQVSLRKRYDLDGGIALWQGRLPAILAESIDAEAGKRGV